jgi:hypothetical protein
MSIRRFGNVRALKSACFYIGATIALTGCSDCGKESGADQQAPTTSAATRGDNPTTTAPPDRPGTRVLDPAARMPMRVGVTPADAGAH